MKKFIKLILALGAAITLLIVVGIVALLVFVDPNDFKPDIEKAAKDDGIALTLGGKLGWQFFPNLGITVQQISVAPAAEPQKVIASIGKADFSVQVMPLLSGRVAVNGIVLDNLDAHLAVDADGKGNWEKITGASQSAGATSPAKEETTDSQFSLAIHELSITNSQVSYDDAKAGQTVELKDFNLSGTDIALDQQAFPLQTSGSFSITDSSKNTQSGHFDLKANIALDKAISMVELSNTQFSLAQAGKDGKQSASGVLQLKVTLPDEKRELLVENLELSKAEVSMDDMQAKQKLSVSNLHVLLLNMKQDSQFFPFKASGTVKVEQADMPAVSTDFDFSSSLAVDKAVNHIRFDKAKLGALLKGDAKQQLDLQWSMDVVLDPLSYKGNVHLAPVNARNAMAVIGQTLPETQSPTAFSKVGLDAIVEGSSNAVKADNLTLTLDDSTFKGEVAVKDIEKQALLVKLKGDKLNADNYMAPASETAATGAASTGTASSSGNEPLIPMALLKELNLDVELAVDSFTIDKLPFTKLGMVINAHDGKVDISRFNGNLYDGPMQLTASIDATGDKAVIDFDASSERLPVGRLLKDLEIEERFSGTANLKAKGHTVGVTQNQLMQSLDASIDLSGQQMQLADVNVKKAVCEFVSAAQKKPLAADVKWDNFTRLRDMTTHVDIIKGIAVVQNLDAGVEEIALKTKGKYNLIKGDFDFHLTTRLAQALAEDATCKVTDKSLLNMDIPIRCKGNLDDIGLKTCLPDMSFLEELAKAKAKEKAREELDAVKAKAKADAEEKLKKKFGEEGGKAAKDLLKGLLRK